MTRVLLVEDNPGDARLIQELLREVPGRPYATTHVVTLATAIDVIDAHDVALVDLTLPDAAGLVTVQRLVAASRALPIVVLTGNADERIGIDALSAGAQDYLRKDEITATLLGKALRYSIARRQLATLEVSQAKLEQSMARVRFISEVTAAATSSLDSAACMRAVAPLLVPMLADGCAIDLVKPSGVERIAMAGAAIDDVPTVSAIEGRVPIATGNTRLMVPLIGRGRAIGAISLAMTSSGRQFGDDERGVVQEMAVSVTLGIDNASLYEHAQRALRGRDEMIAIVSHDLRNPLGVVQLSLGMIENDPSTLRAALPRAIRASEQMRLLVEDLLQITQIDAGTLVIEPKPTELAPFLEEVLEHHRVLAANKRIRVHRAIAPRLGTARIDEHRFTQALGNLLGNAIKFTPSEGEITLGAEIEASGVVISVSDTGPGIQPEHVAHIFDRFWQADRKRTGVGLGLPIAKGIVNAHGGRIDVRSVLGSGTTFQITLPPA
jgi:signal transduction histidine kinase/DNA-binding NarL/FixJ family response regulator